MSPDHQLVPKSDPLDLAADRVIAACDGDVRAAVCALIIAKGLLEAELIEVCGAKSKRYAWDQIRR